MRNKKLSESESMEQRTHTFSSSVCEALARQVWTARFSAVGLHALARLVSTPLLPVVHGDRLETDSRASHWNSPTHVLLLRLLGQSVQLQFTPTHFSERIKLVPGGCQLFTLAAAGLSPRISVPIDWLAFFLTMLVTGLFIACLALVVEIGPLDDMPSVSLLVRFSTQPEPHACGPRIVQ